MRIGLWSLSGLAGLAVFLAAETPPEPATAISDVPGWITEVLVFSPQSAPVYEHWHPTAPLSTPPVAAEPQPLPEQYLQLLAHRESLEDTWDYHIIWHRAWFVAAHPDGIQAASTPTTNEGIQRVFVRSDTYQFCGWIGTESSDILRIYLHLAFTPGAVPQWPVPAVAAAVEQLPVTVLSEPIGSVEVPLVPPSEGVAAWDSAGVRSKGHIAPSCAGIPVADSATTTDTAPGHTEAAPWIMSQQRSMRAQTLHYFDHPQFGVLVYSTPYTPDPLDKIPEDAATELPSAMYSNDDRNE